MVSTKSIAGIFLVVLKILFLLLIYFSSSKKTGKKGRPKTKGGMGQKASKAQYLRWNLWGEICRITNYQFSAANNCPPWVDKGGGLSSEMLLDGDLKDVFGVYIFV